MKTIKPPSRKNLNNWDGYSRRGQAAYDAWFEFEKRMQSQAEDRGMYEPGGLYYGVD